MPEIDKNESQQDEADNTDQGTGNEQEPDWKAEAEKWKSLSRKNEERARENAEKAKRLDEAEDAQKSELQKEREAREKAERRIQEFETKREAEKARDALAKTYEVPAAALRGNTPEELEEHAKELQPLFKKPAGPSSDGQGKNGEQIEGDQKVSTNDLLRAARGL